MDAETTADLARDSLSEYCINDCKAYCCRKGCLPLTKEQLGVVCPNKELQKRVVFDLGNLKYSIEFEKNDDSCPSLKDNMCKIHKNPLRPKTCREFPLFIRGNKLLVSKRCPAVRENMLYPYIAQIKNSGFEIVFGQDSFLE